MSTIKHFLVIFSLLFLANPLHARFVGGQPFPNRQLPRKLIVKSVNNSIQAASQSMQDVSGSMSIKLQYVRQMGGGSHVIQLPENATADQMNEVIELLASDPNVVSVEEDILLQPMLTPDDTFYSSQWHYFEDTAGVNLPKAWDLTTGSSDVVVAVLDTGILPNHADLSGRTVGGYDFISDQATGNDGDGRDSDATDPGDFNAAGECGAGSRASNSSWHGTHVAGTIAAASNNGSGVAGVNWQSRILPVRVLGKCGGSLSDIADAIRWSAGLSVNGVPDNPNPAKVLNLSLGGAAPCNSTMQNAIDAAIAAGSVVVVSAGNSSAQLNNNFVPASCQGVITVAANNRAGNRAIYSNFGNEVEISAPGGELSQNNTQNGVLSTLDGGNTAAADDNAYAYYQGTSMSAPHIAGVASLMFSANLNLSPTEVSEILQSTAKKFANNSSCLNRCGAGIADAEQAILRSLKLNANENTFAFDEISLGQESPEITVTLSNNNNLDTALLFDQLQVEGDNADNFVIKENNCQEAVAKDKSCELKITFKPNDEGLRTASLKVASSKGYGQSVIQLEGTGREKSIVSAKIVKDELLEGSTATALILNREGNDISSSLTVNYNIEGTASNGEDFSGLKGSAVFEPEATSVALEINAHADGSEEQTEDVVVILAESPFYILGESKDAVFNIIDNGVQAKEASSGCFIKRALGKLVRNEELDPIRRFRDEVLMASAPGQYLVKWYYQASPTVNKYLTSNPYFRGIAQTVLTPFVKLVNLFSNEVEEESKTA